MLNQRNKEERHTNLSRTEIIYWERFPTTFRTLGREDTTRSSVDTVLSGDANREHSGPKLIHRPVREHSPPLTSSPDTDISQCRPRWQLPSKHHVAISPVVDTAAILGECAGDLGGGDLQRYGLGLVYEQSRRNSLYVGFHHL